jgi:hypothetical protein
MPNSTTTSYRSEEQFSEQAESTKANFVTQSSESTANSQNFYDHRSSDGQKFYGRRTSGDSTFEPKVAIKPKKVLTDLVETPELIETFAVNDKSLSNGDGDRGIHVPVFKDFYTAKAKGFLSRSSWNKEGLDVPKDASPSGVVVNSIGNATELGLVLDPIFDLEPDANGFHQVARSWYYVFQKEQTIPITSKRTPKKEGKEEGTIGEEVGTTGEGSLMTEKCSQVIEGKGLTNEKCESNRSSVNKIRAYVPEGLVIPDTCTFRHGIWYFVGLIYWKHLEQRLKWDEPIALKYDYLKANIPDWTKVWRWCQANRVVERIGGYAIGDHSYGYRTANPYREQIHRLIGFESKLIAKRLRKANQQFVNRPVLVELQNQLERLGVDWSRFDQLFASHPDRHYYTAHLQTISDKEFRFSQDDFSGRIHTNVTNMYKPLRSLLTIDGQSGELGEIDIKNSQPLFLGIAARKRGLIDEKYMALCGEGKLYDQLADWVGILRETAKSEFIMMLYAKNGYRSFLKSVFERLFPGVAAYIHQMKVKDHRRLAKQMQEAERKFIIDTVCKRIFQERPSIFLTTIHDAILALREDCDFIRDVMLDEFRQVGVHPNLDWKAL